MIVGGDKVDDPYYVRTPTSDLLAAKCLINSTLSTPNSKALVADIKDFYLNTDMDRYEYMRLKKDIIPQEIIEQYDLLDIVSEDEWVYMEIMKGIYGLPQTGILVNKKLTSHLASY